MGPAGAVLLSPVVAVSFLCEPTGGELLRPPRAALGAPPPLPLLLRHPAHVPAHRRPHSVGTRRRAPLPTRAAAPKTSPPSAAGTATATATASTNTPARSKGGLDAAGAEALSRGLEAASPLEIMDAALSTFGNDIAIAFSGAEDVALLHYAWLTGRPFRVFSLDTGRLNPETYRLFQEVEKRYSIRIEYYFPDAAEVEALVREKGLFSFYEDGHQECCRIRKVRPLRRALGGLRAWITGQRRDQSQTRAHVPVVEVDGNFEGLEGGRGSLVKWNPLANVTGQEVWDFLRLMDVPINELHARGFVSIGCEPCTRPVLPGQPEREGRWWWEDAAAKECGLHKAGGSNDDAAADPSLSATASSPEAPPARRTFHRDLFEEPCVAALSRADMEALLGLTDADAGTSPTAAREQATMVVLYAPWCPFCQAMEDSYNELARRAASANAGYRVAKFNADADQKSFAQQYLQLKSYPTILLFPKSGCAPIKYTSEKRDVPALEAFVKALK